MNTKENLESDIFGGFMAVAQSISDKASPMDAGREDEKLPGPDDLEIGSLRGQRSTVSDQGDHIPYRGDDEPEEEPEEEEVEEEEETKEEPEEGDATDDTLEDYDVSEDDLGDAEGEVAAYLQEKLFEKFGFELGDERFESVDDIVEFVREVVEENAKPTYASEELAKMDEFVRNGGDLKQYIEATAPIDPEGVNIDSYSDQKKVIRELLHSKGYSQDKIERAIERYEDAGVLREEAEDALDLLEEYKEETSKKLLEEQKKQKEMIIQEQQKYVESVKNEIEALNDIRGVEISEREKKELFDYIFKPTRNGRTKYQEDYVKSQRNMIESAFFTMKGDALVKKVQKKATSEAASRLRKKLANKGARGRNQSGQGGSSVSDIWGIASSQLRSPF